MVRREFVKIVRVMIYQYQIYKRSLAGSLTATHVNAAE